MDFAFLADNQKAERHARKRKIKLQETDDFCLEYTWLSINEGEKITPFKNHTEIFLSFVASYNASLVQRMSEAWRRLIFESKRFSSLWRARALNKFVWFLSLLGMPSEGQTKNEFTEVLSIFCVRFSANSLDLLDLISTEKKCMPISDKPCVFQAKVVILFWNNIWLFFSIYPSFPFSLFLYVWIVS